MDSVTLDAEAQKKNEEDTEAILETDDSTKNDDNLTETELQSSEEKPLAESCVTQTPVIIHELPEDNYLELPPIEKPFQNEDSSIFLAPRRTSRYSHSLQDSSEDESAEEEPLIKEVSRTKLKPNKVLIEEIDTDEDIQKVMEEDSLTFMEKMRRNMYDLVDKDEEMKIVEDEKKSQELDTNETMTSLGDDEERVKIRRKPLIEEIKEECEIGTEEVEEAKDKKPIGKWWKLEINEKMRKEETKKTLLLGKINDVSLISLLFVTKNCSFKRGLLKRSNQR